MNSKHLLLLLILIFMPFSGQCLDEDDESNSSSVMSSSSGLELGSISDYSEETLEASNQGFLHWEEREFTEAEEPLKRAAEKRCLGSMPKYAFILLDPEQLIKSSHIQTDIIQAGDLMLMAAMRGEETACEYVESFDKCVREITVRRNEDTGQAITSSGLLDTVKRAPKGEIRKWLRGEFKDKASYPPEIQNGLKLFILSVLPGLNEELRKKLEHEVSEEIIAISSEKGQKFVGKRVGDIHEYACKTLDLQVKISESPNYSGESQSQRNGEHNYAYYNTCHKYPYELDLCVRTLNCASQAKIIQDKDQRFIQTQSDPMRAGPVYKKLRSWKPTDRESASLPSATAFVVDSFYHGVSEIFYGNPLWLIETTHMETPWQSIDNTVNQRYGGIWPDTKGPWNKNDPEHRKRASLRKKYKEETENYVKSGSARISIFYSLFLMNAMDQMNQSVMVSEDGKKLEIDLSHTSEKRLRKHEDKILRAETLILKNGASYKLGWLKDFELRECKYIQYSLDSRYPNKKFENFLYLLRKKQNIVIENLNGSTSPESENTAKRKAIAENKKENKRFKKN